MMHYKELGKRTGNKERLDPEEAPTYNLQCGDSLAIATNHIGEGGLVPKLVTQLRQGLKGLDHSPR